MILAWPEWKLIITNFITIKKIEKNDWAKTTSSVLEFAIDEEFKMADYILGEAVNDKNFKLDNYKNDRLYDQIGKYVEVFKVKNKIKKNLKNPGFNNNLKI